MGNALAGVKAANFELRANAQARQNAAANEQTLVERKRKEKGINALGRQFGEAFLAPAEASTATNTINNLDRFQASEDQRIKMNNRQEVLDKQKKAKLDREKAIGVTRNIVGFVKAGLKNGEDMNNIIDRVKPALLQLGVPEEEIGQLPAQLQANPALLDELEGALKAQQSNVRAISKPFSITTDDGKKKTFVQMSDGTEREIEGTLTAVDQADQRNVISNRRVDVQEEKINARAAQLLAEAKARGDAFGKAQGEIDAEDLPTSRTAVAKQRAGFRTLTATTDLALDAIDDALDQLGGGSTGFAAVTSFIPGTPAYKLQAKLLKVVGQEFVNNLQSMRAASKTGGAVGNVSNAEGDKLQSTRFNLDIGQGVDQLRQELEAGKKAILEARDNISLAWKEDQGVRKLVSEARAAQRGQNSPPPQQAPDQEINSLLDKYAPQGGQ